nr:hypothetical protein GCM10020093_105460 [Planobispora longispora]
MYGRLLPYADRLVIGGMGICGWGSGHLVLAELAARLGRAGQAVEHARRAVETHRRLGLSHWEKRARDLLDSLTADR